MERRKSTYLESKVQQQRHDQPNANDNRASDGVEVAAAALVDQALPPHVDTVAPSAGENGNESVHESQAARNVVVGTGGVVQTETKRTEENANVLPFDKCTLVCEPDLGFDLDGACVLDPELGLFNAGRELGLAACSRVLGRAKGREQVGDSRSGGGLRCAVVAHAGLIIVSLFSRVFVLSRHVSRRL